MLPRSSFSSEISSWDALPRRGALLYVTLEVLPTLQEITAELLEYAEDSSSKTVAPIELKHTR